MENIQRITGLNMITVNGWSYPLFITEDGQKWYPRSYPTGNCWMLDWTINKAESICKDIANI